MTLVNQKLLLYWTDGYNPPRKLNVERCKSNYYGGRMDNYTLSAIKGKPTTPPTVDILSDSTINSNNIKGKLFQFQYRYRYLDGEVSAWSSMSQLAEAANEDFLSSDDLTTNNKIQVTLSYSKNLDCNKIDISARITNDVNKDFFLIDTIDNLPLSDVDKIAYIFKNDGQYTTLDLNESNLQFDYLPKLSETQEVVNGNVVVYGNVTEGYNNVPIDIDVVSSYTQRADQPISGSISMTNEYFRYDNSDDRRVYRIYISGTPSMNDTFTVEFTNSANSTFTKASYVVPSDGLPLTDVTNAIYSDLATSSPGPTVYDLSIITNTTTSGIIEFETRRWEETLDGAKNVITSAIGGVGDFYSFKEFKQDAYYNFGIVYYDEFGRHGAVNSSTSTKSVMQPATNPYVQGFAASSMFTINNLPPEWATSYQLVRTKNLSYDKWLYWASKAKRETIDGKDYLFFDIVTLSEVYNKIYSSSVLSYEFAKGDRLRIRDNVDFPNGSLIPNGLDYEILDYNVVTSGGNITNIYLKITDVPAINETDIYLFEVYTPRKTFSNAELNVFYEFGQRYPVIVDTSGVKVHGGSEQDQVSGSQGAIVNQVFNGDSYLKNRLIPTNTDPGTRLTSPDSVEVIIEDPNFSDFYESAVYDEGYPNVIDISYREVKRPTAIYFSQAFVPQSNINGASRFYSENVKEYERNKGDLKKLAYKDNYLVLFQQLKVARVGVFRSILEDLNTASQIGLSQQLLEDKATYYQADVGIGEAASSFARMGSAMYFVDGYKSAPCRLDNQGIEVLSDAHKMTSYFSNKLNNYVDKDDIIGYCDSDKSEYIITINSIPEVSSAETIAYSELIKGFSSFYSYIAESGLSANTYLFTFKNGLLYRHDQDEANHNTFYGIPYKSQIDIVYNDNPTLTKNFHAVSIQSNLVWTLPTITTNLNQLSELNESDFIIEDLGGGDFMNQREGIFYSNFLRDINSGSLIEGDSLKGSYIKLSLENNSLERVELFTCNVKAQPSLQGIR